MTFPRLIIVLHYRSYMFVVVHVIMRSERDMLLHTTLDLVSTRCRSQGIIALDMNAMAYVATHIMPTNQRHYMPHVIRVPTCS